MDILKQQYDSIQLTRELLFSYCETISSKDYVENNENFGGASIRDLHVHVAECYQFWLGKFALKKSITGIKPEEISNVKEMRALFFQTDNIVNEFLYEFKDDWNTTINGSVPWPEEKADLTPLWLYTHTTTHEFHHKGQIVSMTRHLGYIPTDTDLKEPPNSTH